jgi:hypothetical protein
MLTTSMCVICTLVNPPNDISSGPNFGGCPMKGGYGVPVEIIINNVVYDTVACAAGRSRSHGDLQGSTESRTFRKLDRDILNITLMILSA